MVTLVIIVNAIGCTQVNKYEFTEEEKKILKKTKVIKPNFTIIQRTWDNYQPIPFNIKKEVIEKLSASGFKVADDQDKDYDATLYIKYKESKGRPFQPGGYETIFNLEMSLFHNKIKKEIFNRKNQSFLTKLPAVFCPPDCSEQDIYQSLIEGIKTNVVFKYLGQFIRNSTTGEKSDVEFWGAILINNDENRSTRENAADELEQLSDIKAINFLISILKDEKYESVATKVGYTLANISKKMRKTVMESLVPLLHHENSYTRKNAIDTLGKIGSPEVVEILIKALSDNDSKVRYAVVYSLSCLAYDKNEKAIEALTAISKNHFDPKVREGAHAAINGKAPYEILQEMLK